jgi:signal transduction histidine kinase
VNGEGAHGASSPAHAPAPVISARARRVRLLVIDADEVAARQLQRELEASNAFDVTAVAGLDDGLAHIDAEGADAVLVDLAPPKHGLATLAALRGRASGLPIVVLAGRDDEGLALRALGAGASDYLPRSRASGDLVSRAVHYAIERERLLAAERESRRDAEAARDTALRARHALETSEQRRRSLLGSMLRAEEAERQRIALELHDDTVQVMVAALVGMDACQATMDRDDLGSASESMARTRATLSEAVDRVRRMSFELRPPLLDAQGLGPAVTHLIAEVAADCDLETHVDVAVRRYAPEIEILAYRTLRELVANVRRHARARRLDLQLHEQAAALVCALADDGVGFDTSRFGRSDGRRSPILNLGLDATIERVRIAGGAFAIDSVEGEGTTVRFSLPIHRHGDVRA